MSPRRAFTLIELLVVLAILSVMMGLGVFAFARMSRQFKEQGAASMLEATIRQARGSALGSGAPAFVEFDTKGAAPKVAPWAYRTVGQWHFETAGSETPGAFHLNAQVYGAKLVDGKIGKALALGYTDSAGRSGAGFVDCGANVDFDCEDGGYLEAYVYLELLSDGQPSTGYVFNKRTCYSLAVERGGVLVGSVGGAGTRSNDFLVPPRRWTKVAFAWDRRSSRVLVDDAVVGIGPGAQTLLNGEPLTIGGESASFIGAVDEARIMAAVPGKTVELPEGTLLVHNAQPWNAIFFASDGSLDIRYHNQPLFVEVTQGKRRRRVSISMLGTTVRGEVEDVKPEEQEVQAPPPPPPPRKPLLPASPKTDKSRIIVGGSEDELPAEKKD